MTDVNLLMAAQSDPKAVLESVRCCENPHPIVSESLNFCCQVMYCKSCRAILDSKLKEGHTITSHPIEELSPEEKEMVKRVRRRTRRKLRNGHRMINEEE